MDKIVEYLPFLIPLIIAQFALLGYTLYHSAKRGHITVRGQIIKARNRHAQQLTIK